ncbi:uncharacterized protein BDV17DRAFT_203891 [Aspergillus undulatus]|uniref:uncharacterized protein n=1 Tax=Aspergillus undulatus TaxID=1810928 RepID=UPI003CCE2E0F
MRADTSRAKRTGAPDYDDPNFWDIKFATGQDVGEWLNPGESLLEALLSFLGKHSAAEKHATPQVLHLGPGISKLGTKVRSEFGARGWAGNGIVNVDFSSEAVRIGQDIESTQDSAHAMHWMQADLRSWTDVSRLLRFGPFDAILDKSTSDAIATSSPVTLKSAFDASQVCPVIKDVLGNQEELTLSPVELLALHLVPLTRRGSRWFVLSYSTMRFDNIPQVASHWEVTARSPIEAPGGQTASGAYTPAVYHWLYILQRK